MSELYTLPDGWEWKNISDVILDIRTGTTPPKNEQKYYDNPSIRWFAPSDFGEHKELIESKNKINEIAIIDKKAKIYQPNSLLLVAIGATVGKIGIIRNEATSNQQITVLKFKDYIDVDFSYYWFMRIKQIIIDSASTATLPIINQNGIKSLPFPFIQLEEQKRIVAKLDNLFAKIDKAIALHQKNIDEANIFMASVLNDVFVELEEKYEKLFLNDVSTFQNGFAFKSNEFNTTGNGLQVIRIGNVLDINKNQVFIEKRKEFEKYLLKENDIVISMTGTRGKKDYLFVRVITSNDSYLNQRVGKISNKNNSNYMYLYYFLQSNYFRDKIFEFETGTVNQGNISSKDILNTKIPLPNMQVQQKVVSYLDEISQKMEKIKQIQKEKMQSLKALKASILDQAFKGEL